MNLSRLEASVTHLVSLIFIFAIIIGLFWQSAAAFINPSIAYLLMVVIALGFIRVDVKALKQELENWPYQLWLLVLSMVICPLVVYYLIVLGVHLGWLDASFKTGGLLFFSVSTGATAPAIVMLLQGKFARTMLNLALTSLAIIVTLPLMFTLFSTTHLHFSFIALLLFLVKLIVVPLIVAVMLRRIIPKFTESLAQHVPALSVLLLFFVIFGCVSGLDHFFHDSMSVVISALIVSFIGLVICFLLGWFLAFRKTTADRITAGTITAWINPGLAIVIADHFFRNGNPKVILFVSLAVIPWCLMLFPVKFFIKVMSK